MSTPAATSPAAPSVESWTLPFLSALTDSPMEGSVEDVMASVTTPTGWVLMASKFVTGSSFEDPFADQPQRIVAGRAGHLFLYHHHATGQWATMWVPFFFQIDGMPILWGDDATAQDRTNWLAAAAVEGVAVADDLIGLLDIHEPVLATGTRFSVHDPHFAACALILNLDHPDAEAASLLSGLGAWTGSGVRSVSDQPLIGRVRDVQFIALCGARGDALIDVIRGWRETHSAPPLSSAGEWATRLVKGELANMPPVLPPLDADNWEALVAQWCETLSRR
jgi:hypothetical protein